MRERLNVGYDVDGCVANFNKAYVRLMIDYSGRDLFLPGDVENPPCWHYPEFRGYTAQEVSAVWKAITTSTTFWERLEPLPGVEKLGPVLLRHNSYAVTSRPGATSKAQTERFLEDHTGYLGPTVCVTPARKPDRPVKGLIAAGLGLDVYIDDNLDNVEDVARMVPGCEVYLLDKSYNRERDLDRVTPVGSLVEFLERARLL